MKRLLVWVDDRTGVKQLVHEALFEHIPGGARWRYVWGSTLAFVFMIQLITGILLMTGYSASDTTAWGSVHYIQYHMDFGWLIRGLHHFGSQTMMVLIACHMLQVVIAGAHLPPREINWWMGLGLLGVTFGLGLTGYLLPWDQKGYWATRVATSIASKVPGIGEHIQRFLVGGPEYGNHTLTRFFSFHVGLLPAVFIILLILHLTAFRRHGVTHPPNVRGVGVFWPEQAFRDLVACLVVFGVMLSLVIFGGQGNPVTPPPGEEPAGWYEELAKAGQKGWGANLDAPADRDTPGYPARPEWYFLFLFQLLKYFEGPQILVGTFYIPNGVMVLLFLLPLLGIGRLRKFGHFIGIVVVVGLLSCIAILTVQSLAEDSPRPILFGMVGNKDQKKAVAFQTEVTKAHELALRAAQLGMDGIPVEGARMLLRHDPVVAGAKLFQVNCAVCHSYTVSAEEKALGIPNCPKEGKKEIFKASDLSGWGTKEWIKGLLDNPSDPKYFGLTKLEGMKVWRESINAMRASWLEKGKADGEKMIAAQDAEFQTIAEWLADQANPKEKRNKELHDTGIKLFMNACSRCHRFEDKGKAKAPDLTDYGSQEWLRMMIMSPGSKLRHGEENEMPAFRNLDGPATEIYKQEFLESSGAKAKLNHLSDIDRELIIRMMTRDYRVVFGGQPVAGPPKR